MQTPGMFTSTRGGHGMASTTIESDHGAIARRLAYLALLMACLTTVGRAQVLGTQSLSSYSYMIAPNGLLHAWGFNNQGQLGTGDTENRMWPVAIIFPDGVTAWREVAGGSNFSLAIGSNGKLYGWGENIYGQLGTGDDIARTLPQPIEFPDGVGSWSRIAAGSDFSLAIGDDGILYSWGSNNKGQLGIGTTDDQLRPQPVGFPDGVGSWRAIAAGKNHSMAIGSDGMLYTWGNNEYGPLGTGGATGRTTPQRVELPEGVASWSMIAAGQYHSAAIGSDGELYAWGWNKYGQAAVGGAADQMIPQRVSRPAGVTSWSQVSAGIYHTVALGNDGSIHAWGANLDSQLGIGTNKAPVAHRAVILPEGVGRWRSVSAGGSHTLAVGSDGALYAWGANVVGQIGDGTTMERSIPVSVWRPAMSAPGSTPLQLSEPAVAVYTNTDVGTPPAAEASSVDTPVEAPKEGDVIVWNNSLFFESDRHDLKRESYPELVRLAGILKGTPGLRVEIMGHTDDQGSDAYNMTLSDRRAHAVLDYLVTLGCDRATLDARGYGETKPTVANDTDENRALNRRVEARFVR